MILTFDRFQFIFVFPSAPQVFAHENPQIRQQIARIDENTTKRKAFTIILYLIGIESKNKWKTSNVKNSQIVCAASSDETTVKSIICWWNISWVSITHTRTYTLTDTSIKLSEKFHHEIRINPITKIFRQKYLHRITVWTENIRVRQPKLRKCSFRRIYFAEIPFRECRTIKCEANEKLSSSRSVKKVEVAKKLEFCVWNLLVKTNIAQRKL